MKKQKPLKVIILRGLPASGKSTWAKQKVCESQGKWKRINKDDLRSMIDAGSKWSKEKEKLILAARDTLILEALKMDKNVIVDDTNALDKHELVIRELVKDMPHVKVEINDEFLKVPIKECIERDRKRGKAKVGKDVILRMAKTFNLIDDDTELPCKFGRIDNRREIREWDPNLKNCIISDLDGTLALMWGNRSPYEADKSDTDLLNPHVAQILRDYRKLGIHIIIFSGRGDDGKKQTEDWLKKHDIPYDELHMRQHKDYRRDDIIKEEMWKAHVEGKWNVQFILDDRNIVVDKWRELGLLTLQCYYGDF